VLSSVIKEVLHQLRRTWIPWMWNSTIFRDCVVHTAKETQPCKVHSLV